ncbi:hypothetical protein [Novosphingobium barchaimii]|nr:hypothetical protein [Novosphingobium barchaimii]
MEHDAILRADKALDPQTVGGSFAAAVCAHGPGEALIYHSRAKDKRKTSGENAAAVEMERSLMTNPAVKMAQVIGMPDERLMEGAAACIEIRPRSTVEDVELVCRCISRIASDMILRARRA